VSKEEKKWRVVLEDDKLMIYSELGEFLMALKPKKGIKYLLNDDEKK